jgi:hypothetical protein
MAGARKPEPWEISAAAPFLMIDSPRGGVAVESLGQERFRISALGGEQELVGFAAARAMAHRLAEALE